MKKILIGPVEIAGFFGNLATGLRQNGYDVTEVYFSDHLFGYSRDESKTPWLFSIVKKYRDLFHSRPKSRSFSRLVHYFIFQVSLHLFFLQALVTYQVFIFGFGISLFENDKDLKWLRRFGKTVISNVALGSEARPPYIDGARRNPDGSFLTPEALIHLSKRMKRKIEGIEKYSSIVIGAPLTSQFLEKPFVNLFELGLPYPEKKVQENDTKSSVAESSVKILHSPSHPYAKGSDLIRKAINSLKEKGYKIDYIELTQKSNSEILEAISTCDIVVDQAFSDTAMATFATEASFYGKPVVVGGYGWETLSLHIPSELFPPTQICKPDQMEVAIERLIVNKSLRIKSGAEAKSFVSKNWESKIVGKKFINLIENQVPASWYLDPMEIFYTHGVGISEEDSKKLVKSVISIYGESSLFLENKENLKKQFIEFAAG